MNIVELQSTIKSAKQRVTMYTDILKRYGEGSVTLVKICGYNLGNRDTINGEGLLDVMSTHIRLLLDQANEELNKHTEILRTADVLVKGLVAGGSDDS